MKHRPLIFLLLISLVLGEIAIWLLQADFAAYEPAYRVYHLAQMLVLILAAVLARSQVAAQSPWPAVWWLILLGLGFSLAGDVINSFLFDLSHVIEPQTLLSVGPFALAHVLYITVFWRLGRTGMQPIPAALVLINLLVWPALAVSLWLVLVDITAGPLLKWLSLGYAHMLVLMALCSLWPLKSLGRRAWIAAAGGLIFLFSDAFFGAYLTQGQARPLWVSQVIWVSYFLAQLCMMHVPLIAEREEKEAA